MATAKWAAGWSAVAPKWWAAGQEDGWQMGGEPLRNCGESFLDPIMAWWPSRGDVQDDSVAVIGTCEKSGVVPSLVCPRACRRA